MDYQLAKDLYATGNADAMYLAGLIADDEKMTRSDLQIWAEQAVSNNISEYTVPWVAAGNPYGFDLAMEWIDNKEGHIAASGWATLSNIMALKPDDELDISALKKLLQRITQNIHAADHRVRQTMNSFMIAAGVYVQELTGDAIAAALEIGVIRVDKNGTACKVPAAVDHIMKIKNKGGIGKKKKMVKC